MNNNTNRKKCPYAALTDTAVWHWLMQRISAIVLIPLPLWIVFYFKQLLLGSQMQVQAWLSSPWNIGFLVIMALAVVYHALLGVQVILDDYVHHEGYKKQTMWWLQRGLLALLAVLVAALLLIAIKG